MHCRFTLPSTCTMTGSTRLKHPGIIILLLACSSLVFLQRDFLFLLPFRGCTNKGNVYSTENSKFSPRVCTKAPKVVASIPLELHEEALKKKSSLRFDWTNLPPLTPLGQAIEKSQAQCLNAGAVKEYGPQKIVTFQHRQYGLGSDLHTWMDPLCHAAENNKVLITGGNEWIWNAKEECSLEFRQKQALKPEDWPAQGSPMSWAVPELSSLWCYFGWHESALRCPPGTLAWNESVVDHGSDWVQYKCEKIEAKYGRMGIHTAGAEWLFQNVSKLVIEEAERQIREEAFPIDTSSTEHTVGEKKFRRWIGMPDANSLITVHIRWGDKGSEMELVSMDAVINATLSILTPEELSGHKVVHVYVATEDPEALRLFREAAVSRKWQVHASGPTNPVNGSFPMQAAAQQSSGRAGLESLAALLIALEANRYVLTRASNWSRLIDELRKSILDPRCGNCTVMIDLRDGDEWR